MSDRDLGADEVVEADAWQNVPGISHRFMFAHLANDRAIQILRRHAQAMGHADRQLTDASFDKLLLPQPSFNFIQLAAALHIERLSCQVGDAVRRLEAVNDAAGKRE